MEKIKASRMKVIIYFVILFYYTGCIYGPTVEHKSVLNNLNGENYTTSPNMASDSLLVPFTKTKERKTLINGKIVAQEDSLLPSPLRFIELTISNEKGDVLQKVTAAANGDFTFSGAFPNGNYSIKVNSSKYSGGLNIEVKAYVVENLIVQAHRL